ncbi:MAG TPA: hypothetical protein VFV50_12230 [Bdellovibrionales bacterium]|nr:hypothetical protein [Bdellovibrionales bacterium]
MRQETIVLSDVAMESMKAGDSWGDTAQWALGQTFGFGLRLFTGMGALGGAMAGYFFGGAGSATLISSECTQEYHCYE